MHTRSVLVRLPSRWRRADRPTETEVVYSHVDIKLHPLQVQLDGSMISALTSFFKVKEGGARQHKSGLLDQSLGLASITRACTPSHSDLLSLHCCCSALPASGALGRPQLCLVSDNVTTKGSHKAPTDGNSTWHSPHCQ